jgi:hypothetical protein
MVTNLAGVGEATPERPDGQREDRYFRGVAAVPQRTIAPTDETGEVLPPGQAPPPDAVVAGRWRAAIYRWRRGQVGAAAPPGGRWRTLRRGAGWSMAGLWFAVISWGMWAISRREDLLGSFLAMGVVLAIAALVFTVSRLLGRVVLEGTMGRQRFTAWPSHLVTFLLLVVGGVAFLQQTWWLVDAWRWFTDKLV